MQKAKRNDLPQVTLLLAISSCFRMGCMLIARGLPLALQQTSKPSEIMKDYCESSAHLFTGNRIGDS